MDIRKHLAAEVLEYDYYLRGEVYWYRRFTYKTCETCGHQEEETGDSCGGFIGQDFKENGLFENAGIDNFDDWEEV